MKWVCDYIVYQCWRPPQAHSKDLHSSVVAAFTTVSVWIMAHPQLLQSRHCLHNVLEVIELGISGVKSQVDYFCCMLSEACSYFYFYNKLKRWEFYDSFFFLGKTKGWTFKNEGWKRTETGFYESQRCSWSIAHHCVRTCKF